MHANPFPKPFTESQYWRNKVRTGHEGASNSIVVNVSAKQIFRTYIACNCDDWRQRKAWILSNALRITITFSAEYEYVMCLQNTLFL